MPNTLIQHLHASQTGGEAIASGGYGCVFSPAIKCQGDVVKVRDVDQPAGVSKLVEKSDLKDEIQVALEMYKTVKVIPNYSNYFLFPISHCSPGPVRLDDLIGFDAKCRKFSSSSVYNPVRVGPDTYQFPNDTRIINAPHGGEELQALIRANRNNSAYVAFTLASLAELLVKAVGPMNALGVFHNDMKGENLMVGRDGHLRIIDWGLGGKASGSAIPSFVKGRPFQFNLPFSILLFDGAFPKNQCNAPLIETVSSFVTSTMGIPLCFDTRTEGSDLEGPSHYKYVVGSFVPALFECGSGAGANLASTKDLVARQTFTYVFLDYLLTIAKKFTKGSKLDLARYFHDVYKRNADVWGLVTTVITFLKPISNQSNTLFGADSDRIRELVVKYLFSSTYAAQPIPIRELAGDMMNIASSIVKRLGKTKVARALPPPYAARLMAILSTKQPSPQPKAKAEAKAKVSPKPKPKPKASPKSRGSKEGRCPAGHFRFLGACRTSSGRAVKTRSSGKKRCPNGTRRNRKTGECEPK